MALDRLESKADLSNFGRSGDSTVPAGASLRDADETNIQLNEPVSATSATTPVPGDNRRSTDVEADALKTSAQLLEELKQLRSSLAYTEDAHAKWLQVQDLEEQLRVRVRLEHSRIAYFRVAFPAFQQRVCLSLLCGFFFPPLMITPAAPRFDGSRLCQEARQT